MLAGAGSAARKDAEAAAGGTQSVCWRALSLYRWTSIALPFHYHRALDIRSVVMIWSCNGHTVRTNLKDALGRTGGFTRGLDRRFRMLCKLLSDTHPTSDKIMSDLFPHSCRANA